MMRTILLASFIASSLQAPCAENAGCSVNVTNFADVAENFRTDVTAWGALGANFRLQGVDWGMLTDSETFDPNWWSWFMKGAGSLVDMPLDYDILSVGMLSMRIKDYELEFSSSPPGCFSSLSDVCKREVVKENLLNITAREKVTKTELICESVIKQKSLLTGNEVGVCKKCWKRNDLLQSAFNWTKDAEYHQDKFEVRRILVFLFGTILPILSIPLLMAWADFKPLEVGHGFADYASNKFCKLCHFKIRGVSTSQPLDQKTVLIRENDMVSFEGPIMTIASISGRSLPVKMAKLKFTVFFLLQYIPIGLWIYIYGKRKQTMMHLDTWEEIVFNLRNNPFSWIHTSPKLWPYKFAIFLIFLNVVSFVCLLIWWLLEIEKVRKLFMDIILKGNLYGKLSRSSGRFKKRRTGIPLEKIFRHLFIALFITLMMGTYMVVFSIFHCVIFTLGGIVVNIELVASWLTGVALVIFYVNRSYTGVKAKYTEIKRIMFEESMQLKVYKGTMIVTCDIIVNDTEKCTMLDRDKQLLKYKWMKSEGPVVFYSKDTSVFMPKRVFLQICQNIEPLGSNLKAATVDLLFTLFFLGLVVFTIAVFRPYNASNEMNVVVTSIVTLLTALIPQLAEMTKCQTQEDLEKSVLHYKVKKAVAKYKPMLRTLESTVLFDSKSTIVKRLGKGSMDMITPEIMAPLGTRVIGGMDSMTAGAINDQEFDPSSSLPTPQQTMDGILPQASLPTIPSDSVPSPVPSRPENNNNNIGGKRLERLRSNDSGMMVLNLDEFLNPEPQSSSDDIAYIDESPRKESARLFEESSV